MLINRALLSGHGAAHAVLGRQWKRYHQRRSAAVGVTPPRGVDILDLQLAVARAPLRRSMASPYVALVIDNP